MNEPSQREPGAIQPGHAARSGRAVRSGLDAQSDSAPSGPTRHALRHARLRAEEQRDRLPSAVPAAVLERVHRSGVITVNFHPDRPGRDGRTAAEGLVADGVYRTQFSTGTSSGGLDAALGGARSRWEDELFDGAYAGAPGALRPRYGGLDLTGDSLGACPRFGSCLLRLRPEAVTHSTFTWGDSATGPTAVGVWEVLEPVVAAAIVDRAPELDGQPRPQIDRLDGYIEVQIHRPITGELVEAVVADPSFRDGPVAGQLTELARRWDTPLRWHQGRALPPDRFDPTFRTALSPVLADTVHRWGARAGQLVDAELIGRAATDVSMHPDDWREFGERSAVLQELKYLWHHLVAFGEPA